MFERIFSSTLELIVWIGKFKDNHQKQLMTRIPTSLIEAVLVVNHRSYDNNSFVSDWIFKTITICSLWQLYVSLRIS